MRLREVGRIAQVTGWYEPRLETEEIWLWELDIRPLAPLPHLRKPQPRLGYAKDGARQGGEDRSRGKHRAGFVEYSLQTQRKWDFCRAPGTTGLI